MDLAHILHMNGGVDEASYANNSSLQRTTISLAKPSRLRAITNLYCSLFPRSLAVADLGCSSGLNTLLVISEIINVVEKLCQELNHESPEYKVFLNDLPGNDFNNVFRSLETFKEKLCNEIGPCYFFGVPGSFYGRIFPYQSLHFIHASCSLHWLSKVPKGVDNNKGNIYLATTSPSNVFKAYYEQFHRDLSLFLKCRAQELVEGGCMVITFLVRECDNPSSYGWELLAMALNDMVMQGIIEEEKLNTFNIPIYFPSPSEIKVEVLTEESFDINGFQVSQVNRNDLDNCNAVDLFQMSETLAKCARAVIEPLLISHFGEGVTEEVFNRYKNILQGGIFKEKNEATNLTITLTKKP
ncbi:putative salicylate carboxymethyltransferase [Medicago truncatula]|uniref:Putative salicylate carboxymethyltransferase n=1 Tax=Medicago truncatula TaxID=3880 RepID=A0A396HL21_MEDTR|nr:S-adenosyl-L-methionine:benzoic acid/salicylic acid carboxyl methyltransferase 3-like [Medicago truncatula]RHN51975.1 putative salicylate carboxymethyltransferase [Medicago truncatula]